MWIIIIEKKNGLRFALNRSVDQKRLVLGGFSKLSIKFLSKRYATIVAREINNLLAEGEMPDILCAEVSTFVPDQKSCQDEKIVLA